MRNKKTLIYIYYAMLIILLVSRMNATSDPPVLLRLVYIAAVIIPTLTIRDICYPAIMTLFYVISLNGFAYSYMPYNLWFYAIITVIVLLYYGRRGLKTQTKEYSFVPQFVIALAFYIFLVDLIYGVHAQNFSIVQDNLYCFLLLGFFLLIIRGKESAAKEQLPICFAVTTIVLCFAFLTNREQYILQSYADIDRTGWTDPNYFGTVIGMGTICGLIKLFSKEEWKELGFIEKWIYLLAIILSVPVLLLNASRGAVLAVITGIVILFVFSKASVWYKVIVVAIGGLAMFYLYTHDYFSLLLLRVENDDGYGSERTLIWASKLRAYTQGNILQMIFGYGSADGLIMGWGGKAKGFHNDYVGFIVDYGIVGICLFLYMLYYPMRIMPHDSKKRPAVIVLLVYIMTCIFTLEPFIMGVLAYFVLYMYALILAQTERKCLVNRNTTVS